MQVYISLLCLLLCSASQVELVRAHGYMTVPASRNIDSSDRQSLAAGGPSTVHNGGAYLHGMCGNSATEQPQNWNEAGTPVATYQEGESIIIEVVITAHHLGFFEFMLCDSPNITETCFRNHRLLRSNCNITEQGLDECRRWWKPAMSSETGSYSLSPDGYPDGAPYFDGPTCGDITFKMAFDIPANVSCTHCVLRWHWLTTNSCTPGPYSEEFWNCADVTILGTEHTKDTSVTGASLAQLNQYLTSLQPTDLSAQLTDSDNWVCPDDTSGGADAYSCNLPSDYEGGCVSSGGCPVSYYVNEGYDPSVQDAPPATAYCSFNGICATDGFGSSAWCDESLLNCESCAGMWCAAATTTPAFEPTTMQQRLRTTDIADVTHFEHSESAFTSALPAVFTVLTTGSLCPLWSPNSVSYTEFEDRVTYNNVVYQCIQSHTSLPSWNPEAAMSLWTTDDEFDCSGKVQSTPTFETTGGLESTSDHRAKATTEKTTTAAGQPSLSTLGDGQQMTITSTIHTVTSRETSGSALTSLSPTENTRTRPAWSLSSLLFPDDDISCVV